MPDRRQELSDLYLIAMAPFIVCFMGVWLSPWVIPGSIAFDFREFALIYGAAVVAYFAGFGAGGGVHKGVESPAAPMVAAAVALAGALPVGAFGITLPNIARFLLVIGALVFLLLRDQRATAAGVLPAWYGALRTRLTFWASISLLMIVARLLL